MSISKFIRKFVEVHDLTEGNIDYPQLLLGTKDKGPDIIKMEICACGAYMNRTQAETIGRCTKCVHDKEQRNQRMYLNNDQIKDIVYKFPPISKRG